MKHALIALVALALLAAPAAAQTTTPPRNPTAIAFTSVDHDNPALTGYEVDFVKADGTVLQTVSIAKASTTKLSTGEIAVTVSVQPVAFGFYTFTARAVASTVKSDTSAPSDVWQRSPGPPGKPRLQ